MDVRFFIKKYKAYIFIAYQESLVSFHTIFFFLQKEKWEIVNGKLYIGKFHFLRR